MPCRRGKRSKAAIERRIDRGIEARIRAGQIPAEYAPPTRNKSRSPVKVEKEEIEEPEVKQEEAIKEEKSEDEKEFVCADEVIYAFAPDWGNDDDDTVD